MLLSLQDRSLQPEEPGTTGWQPSAALLVLLERNLRAAGSFG